MGMSREVELTMLVEQQQTQILGYQSAWAILRDTLGLPATTESGQDVLDAIRRIQKERDFLKYRIDTLQKTVALMAAVRKDGE